MPDDATSTAANEDDWLLDIDDSVETDGDEDTSTEDNEQGKSTEGQKPEDEEGSKDAGQKAEKSDEAEADKSKPEDGKPEEGKPDTAKQNEDDEAERKRHNNEMAQQRIQSKKALEAGLNKYVDEAKKKVDDAGDDEVKRKLAELEAKDAERDAQEFLRTVATNESIMRNDHARIASEFPMFNPNDPEHFNQKAYDRALEHLAPHLQTQRVVMEDGTEDDVIIGSDVSVYEFLKGEAEYLGELIGSERTAAELEGQRNEQKMRGAAEIPSGSAPQRLSKEDQEAKEMDEAFDSI